MLQKLLPKLKLPAWARKSDRYTRLSILDRLLDGTLYDDLPAAFYDEEDEQGKYIPLENRRPCVQFNLPMYVAKTTARKLFAGNHTPKLIHEKDEVVQKLKTLANSSNLFYFMLQASIWGSVGSVCATFKIVEEKFLIEIWRSRFCWPQFALDGQLESLRIAYLVRNLPEGGKDEEGDPIKADKHYWFIRDLDGTAEKNYVPIKDYRWNPIDGDNTRLHLLPEDEDGEVAHNLGFIPAVWGINLAGGEMPDGASTFAPAISMALDMDYTMSQIGRGVRYNAAPTTAIIGEITDESGYDRSKMILHLKAGIKDAAGMTVGTGDAKLLEMTGGSVDASLKYVAFLRKMALETCAAARKDPTTTKGPMSGKAVEALDDQFVDLVQELRTSMGDTFMLTLVKKMLLAGLAVKHPLCEGLAESDIESIGVVWKRALPTPPEALVQVSSAVQTLVDAGLLDMDMGKKFVHMTLDLDALDAQEAVTNVTNSGARPEPTPDDVSVPNPQKVSSGGNLSSTLIDKPLDSTPHR